MAYIQTWWPVGPHPWTQFLCLLLSLYYQHQHHSVSLQIEIFHHKFNLITPIASAITHTAYTFNITDRLVYIGNFTEKGSLLIISFTLTKLYHDVEKT